MRQASSGSDAEFQGVHWEARPFEDSPYYGARISYFPGPKSHVGANLDFTHYKMYAKTEAVLPVLGTWDGSPINVAAPLSDRVQNLEISHGVNLTGLDIEYRWLTGNSGHSSRWQPHAGAGLVTYFPHAEGEINTVSSGGDYQRAGWGYQLLGGTEYRVTKHLSLWAEAKYDQGRLKIDLSPEGQLETRVRTLHAVGGVAWHF